MATVISLNEAKEGYNKVNNNLKEAIIEEINKKIRKAVRNHKTMAEYEFHRNEISLTQIIQAEYIKAGFEAEIVEYTDQFDHNPPTISLIVSGWIE